MTQPTLEAAQAKIDGLAKKYFDESDYELFCAVLLQLEKYKSLADSNREAMYSQDKEFIRHTEIQKEEIDTLRRSVEYWQKKCTLLFVENDRLVNESGEGAEHGGGDGPDGIDTKCG